MKPKKEYQDLTEAVSRGAKKAQAAIRQIEQDYEERTSNVRFFRKRPKNHEESFRMYGECRVPGCKCDERPVFSRRRF